MSTSFLSLGEIFTNLVVYGLHSKLDYQKLLIK